MTDQIRLYEPLTFQNAALVLVDHQLDRMLLTARSMTFTASHSSSSPNLNPGVSH
jgi:hypothetical protein